MDSGQNSGPDDSALQTRHRYTLHREIAWGGMATVRLGRQSGPLGLSRIVAVKTLLARSAPDSEFMSMFRDEIRVACRVNHPNVVPVLDVVAADDDLLLVMEYVHGESVARLLKRSRTAIPPKIASTIMVGVLRGLHAAHLARSERGEPLQIVHRDVTPHNMVVGVDGTPRLLDFGIAHAVGRTHATRFGHVKGKLAYMAPEQFLDAAVDRRVDIYSAAVTLWEMLAGRKLFEGHKDQILRMILQQEVHPPGFHQSGIPPQLDAIVLRGLQRDPRRRFQTAREMAVALEQQTETVSATELGDWVSRVWGEARARREEQIRVIENDHLPVAEGSPPTAQDPSDDGTPPRLPSSRSLTRALDLEERALRDTPEPGEPETRREPGLRPSLRPSLHQPPDPQGPGEPTRPDLPSPMRARLRRAPVSAVSARADAGRRASGVRRGAPIVLAAAAILLAAYLQPGTGHRPERGPGLTTVSTVPDGPPARVPSVEPLRASQTSIPAQLPPAPDPRGGVAPPPSSAPVLSPKPLDQPVPAAPPRAATIDAPNDAGPQPRLKRRASPHHAPLRATAVAAVGPSNRVLAATARPGPLPRVVAPTPSPEEARETSCDPPYVVDSTGIKHFKLACL